MDYIPVESALSVGVEARGCSGGDPNVDAKNGDCMGSGGGGCCGGRWVVARNVLEEVPVWEVGLSVFAFVFVFVFVVVVVDEPEEEEEEEKVEEVEEEPGAAAGTDKPVTMIV